MNQEQNNLKISNLVRSLEAERKKNRELQELTELLTSKLDELQIVATSIVDRIEFKLSKIEHTLNLRNERSHLRVIKDTIKEHEYEIK